MSPTSSGHDLSATFTRKPLRTRWREGRYLRTYRDPSQPSGWLIRTNCLNCGHDVQYIQETTWDHVNSSPYPCTPNPDLYQINELDL